MHGLMAKTVQALAQVVCKRGLIQLSFADVRSLYGRYVGSEALENCWVTHIEGDMRDCPEDLVTELLEGPLVSNEAIWKQIDHAIVAVSGTRHLGLSDVQEMVSVLKDRLPVNIPIATSASLEEENHEKVRMSVLFAMTAPITASAEDRPPAPAKKARPVAETVVMPEKTKLEAPAPQPTAPASKSARPKPAPAKVEKQPVQPVAEEVEVLSLEAEPPVKTSARTKQRFIAKQEEMQFEAPTRGRFEKTHETMYRGENLDQPTFRRRGLKVKV
jgi:cell division protein FtsZ